MADPLDFYFDFSSPYGYIAANRIDAIAAKHGRVVSWRPFLLGVVFQRLGGRPLTRYPLKGDYSRHDFERSAREHGIAFAMPDVFPLATQVAARAVYCLVDRDPAAARRFAKAVYSVYFTEGRDISEPAVLVAVADGSGIDGERLLAEAATESAKARLRAETDDAIARGVFGSPFVFVDGEPFWGNDRLDMIDRWLARGGW